MCKVSDVSLILHDNGDPYGPLAKAAVGIGEPGKLRVVALPWTESYHHIIDWCQHNRDGLGAFKALRSTSEHDVAYLHHTSGTSTGLPKPIPQRHRAGVGVLPCLTNGSGKATFTTTPLYHGGIADCFRAWTSGAMIWLFPGQGVPITAGNILKSFDCAQKSEACSKSPPVRYFSSVPYVLQLLAEDPRGLEMLQSMDIVGVGGAALPEAAGDDLVGKGVKLISRFGSAECGFLLSSHRQYTEDKAWQYLRTNLGCEALQFEDNGDGLAELVIRPSWPHMAKQNREDGSYATSDLFAAHPSIANAWKYHSRADSQLTLITGKKFDPAPLEGAIAASPLLSDVLIFGNGEQYPGALLFRSKETEKMTDSDIIQQIWPTIDKLNQDSQGHTRLSKSMLMIMPSDAPRLEKSSKGTILRAQAEERYRSQIVAAYSKQSNLDSDDDDRAPIEDETIGRFVMQTIQKVAGAEEAIPQKADYFAYGIDSVACMQIRAILQERIMPSGSPPLPLNVVYDCRNTVGLSRYLQNLRHGRKTEREDELELMRSLVKEHGNFSKYEKRKKSVARIDTGQIDISSETKVVLLTGATGALGAHILHQLRADSSIYKIICLVRAVDSAAACARVHKSLLQRRKPGLETTDKRVQVLIGKAGAPSLGLEEAVYELIRDQVTHIIHAAWAVNFSMRLRSFVSEHIIGLQNLLAFAITSPREVPPKFIFCSSTASVLGSASSPGPTPESISTDPSTSSPLGYSRSKWVAEAICKRADEETRIHGHVSVLRIGQLCGDTENGVWNVTEAWPLMLSTVKVTGSLPELKDEKLSWLPVDIAATATIQISLWERGSSAPARTENDNPPPTETSPQHIPVYHILNPHHTPTWLDLLSWLQRLKPSLPDSSTPPTPFQIVPPATWLRQLENLHGDAAHHPARKLLGLWKDAYGADDDDDDQAAANDPREQRHKHQKPDVTFEMERTKEVAPVMRDVRPIGEEQFGKLWGWIEREMCAERKGG